MPGSLRSEIASSPAFDRLASWIDRIDVGPPNVLRVLTYHRVEREDAQPPPPGGVTVTPATFADQMLDLESRCRVVGLDEVLGAAAGRQVLPPRAVLITFDDAYREFQIHAWPVLKRHGFPVTVFVPTAFPGDRDRWFWWDRLHHALAVTTRREPLTIDARALSLETAFDREAAFAVLRAHAKQLEHQAALAWVASVCQVLGVPAPPSPVLDWDEIRALKADGVTFASHTRNHPLLTRVPIETARAELADARRDLERELGVHTEAVAYPSGAFDDEVVRIAGEEGYRLGFTTVRGVNPLGAADPMRLRRINVGRGTSRALLRGQLSGLLARFPGFRNAPASG